MPDNPSGQLAGTSGIGALRWQVTLYRRDQSAAEDLALQETLVPIAIVRADIQPTYASTFYASTQVDTPITHMINVRWLDYPSTIEVIARTTQYPTPRTELYRVRRTKEVGGRKRFLQMECEIEHSRPLADDSDAARNEFLTEPYSYTDAPVGTVWDVDGATTWDDGATVWDVEP